MAAAEFRLARLSARDLLGTFSCGEDPEHQKLNDFLKKFARQDQTRQHSATWLAWCEEELVGFVTIVPGALDAGDVVAHVPNHARYPAPVLILARMAVDAQFQRKGVGRALVRLVFEQACDLASRFGCVGVFVDAKARGRNLLQRRWIHRAQFDATGVAHGCPAFGASHRDSARADRNGWLGLLRSRPAVQIHRCSRQRQR
jgi:GNAT superfamily N-acetyltransferase